MQIKLFIVPVPGGEQVNEELNRFMRSHRIISVQEQAIQGNGGAFWCYSVRYAESTAFGEREKPGIDYRELLGEAAFKRFSTYREIRKKVAKDDEVPAYMVFSDAELAALAKLEVLTEAGMKSVSGIGVKKVERYGRFFMQQLPLQNEKSGKPDAADFGAG